tara:strand:- start:145 stop:636 length:492 start_codon:yes stop_codon:yes gene_type:complete
MSDMFQDPRDGQDLKTDVEILKRDVAGVANLVDRFDITIEKLGEISESMNRILAVHEIRLENQQKEMETFLKMFQEHKEDHRKESELLHDRISTKHGEVKIEVDRGHQALCTKIDAMNAEMKNQTKVTNDRITKLEQWKWWVMGICIGMITLLSQSKTLMDLF